jgi:hypothetical protein
MSTNNDGRIIPVGEELPPLETERSPAKRSRRQKEPSGAQTKGTPPRRRRTRQRFCEINTFCDETLARLQRAEVALWLLLWRDTRPDGRARVGQADLARRAGCTERSVRRALVVLERLGLVKTVYQGGWPKRVSIYRVQSVTTLEEGT